MARLFWLAVICAALTMIGVTMLSVALESANAAARLTRDDT